MTMLRKKRIAMVLTLAVMLAALMALGSAGTALAQTIGGAIQCQTKPCVASGAHQVLFEKGNGGHDLLRVNDGDALDGAIGGAGYDLCVVDAAIEAADTCEAVRYR
jgi:hypothetical protein